MRWLGLVVGVLICFGCSTRPSEIEFTQFDANASLRFLESEKPILRLRAAKRLAEIGDDGANVMKPLLERLDDELQPKLREEYVRCLTMLVHSRIEKKLQNREIDDQVVEKLDYLLKFDSDPDVRTMAGTAYLLLSDSKANEPNSLFIFSNISDSIERDHKRSVFAFASIIAVGLLFVPFAALIFSVGTLGIGLVWSDFAVSGPDGWRFRDFYCRYLIVAAIFTFVCLPIMVLPIPFSALVAVGVLTVTMQSTFGAGWVHAAIVGGTGILILFVFADLLSSIPFH